MQDLDLPLFSHSNSTLIKNTHKNKIQQTQDRTTNPLKSLENIIENIFPQDREESTILKSRRLLGKRAITLTDEQIHCIVTEFQFLINKWLDEFERDVFNDMTLKEVLNEK